ncbi:MAG: lactate racemase domain-containing protein [Actinobacteria bacterium]|nr:lactate racemase domain-containing protein [Actinomycetota bacterium]MCL5674435.1 lactate racemase domain-containing protein [Candidatus Omnitrophota bacterium]
MIIYKNNKKEESCFSEEEIFDLCEDSLKRAGLTNKRVLCIIPDTTRSGPTDFLFKTVSKILSGFTKKADFIIALGTHPRMEKEKIYGFLSINEDEKRTIYKNTNIFQHQWDNPEQLKSLGIISKDEISEISNGLLSEDIPVTINKKVFDYDEILTLGPVFPHEVVGFSGGYKYLFPGISGPEFLHRFHWLGALITNTGINGFKDTPVRQTINKAVSLINIPITNMCYVVRDKKIAGFYIGDNSAWSEAADFSACINIKYVEKPFHTVLSISPKMYEELWTAGKCMYKLEPVVENNGTLIIYAPHIKEVSVMHGKYIKQIGYHTRDYFLKQMDKFKDIPGGTLAHSTHVKGLGTFENGIEKPRVNVVLATGISEEECRKINLDYMDYRKINIEDYKNKEEQGILVVENAGEILYRLTGSGKI